MDESARPSPAPAPHVIGRYALYGQIAAGGMATVHYGRLLGPVGFSRTVAIKRLHPHFAKDPEFVAMFLDEARLAARIRHPNVVQTLDVVARDGELFLVMDYVQGESLSRLVRAARDQNRPLPPGIVSAILCGALQGLHAAHEATNERGEALGIVHRDVSPQNVLVGADGVPRVLDFGVAKAAGRIHTTREGQLKGKIAYMAVEQLRAAGVDRRTDVYAAGVVLWEALTLQRLFVGDSEAAVVTSVLDRTIPTPSSIAGGLPPGLDDVVMRALERDPARRFASAQDMALALEGSVTPSSNLRVREWIQGLVGDVLARRALSVAQIENDSDSGKIQPLPSEPPADKIPPRSPRVGPPAAIAAAADHPTLTQMTSISGSTSALRDRVAPRWSRPRVVFAATGIGAVAIVTVTLAAMSARAPAPAPPLASGVTSVAPAATAPVVPPAGPAQEQAAAPPPPAAILSPAPASPAPVRSDPKPSGARPSQAPRPAAPAVAAAPSAAPVCTVRAYVDDSGIKHYAKECK